MKALPSLVKLNIPEHLTAVCCPPCCRELSSKIMKYVKALAILLKYAFRLDAAFLALQSSSS